MSLAPEEIYRTGVWYSRPQKLETKYVIYIALLVANLVLATVALYLEVQP